MVLMLVLVMIPVLALIGMYLYRSVQFQSRLAHESHRRQQAMGVAEAGIEEAILRLNEYLATSNRWYTNGASPVSFPGVLTNRQGRRVGEYRVTIIEPRSKRPTIVSTASVPDATAPVATRTVRVTTEMPDSYCDWGLYAFNDFQFDQNFVMDSYDSTEGPYDPANPGTDGDIGGAVLADAYFSWSTVKGDIQVGGSVTYGGSLDVTGWIVEGEPGIPPKPYPDDELAAVKLSNDNGQILIDGAAFSGGTELVTGHHAVVVSPPGDYYFTRIELGQHSEIRIIPDGPARIYVEAPSPTDTAVQFDQGVDVNIDPYTANPHNFWLFVKQGNVQADQAGTIYGVIFAPDSNVQIDQNGGYYGAVVGNYVSIDAGGGFHYDESLGTNRLGVKGALVTSWTEVLPNNRAVAAAW